MRGVPDGSECAHATDPSTSMGTCHALKREDGTMTGIVPTVFRFPGTLAHGASPGAVARSFNGWDPAGASARQDARRGLDAYQCILSRAASCTTSTSMEPTGWIPFDHGRLRNGRGPSIRLVTSAGRQRPVGPDPRPGRGGSRPGNVPTRGGHCPPTGLDLTRGRSAAGQSGRGLFVPLGRRDTLGQATRGSFHAVLLAHENQ